MGEAVTKMSKRRKNIDKIGKSNPDGVLNEDHILGLATCVSTLVTVLDNPNDPMIGEKTPQWLAENITNQLDALLEDAAEALGIIKEMVRG